jgi:hypothetical protein
VPLRLLALVRLALEGSRDALRESVQLAHEYFGRELLFADAYRVLFPQKINPGLARTYPATGAPPAATVAFIQAIRTGAGGAGHVPGKGWTLEPSSERPAGAAEGGGALRDR